MARDRSGEGSDRRVLPPLQAHQHVVADPRRAPHLPGAGAVTTLSEGRIGAEAWRSLIVGGVARGSVYAIIAVGYTLVYGVLFMINFAHGEVFMAGAFSTLLVAQGLDRAGLLNGQPLLSIAILFASSMTISMGVALLLERVAYRPIREAPRLVALITSVGASLFLQGTFFRLFGASSIAYPDIEVLEGRVLGGVLARTQLIVIVAAAVLMVGLHLFVFLFNQVRFFMGTIPGIKAFTAAVLGGIGNVTGAAIGGLILGVVENVGPILFLSGTEVPAPNQLQPVIAFGILVLVLIFRPGGILGSSDPGRG